MKLRTIVIFILCGLFLYACGGEGGGEPETVEIPEEVLDAAAKENAVILREPSAEKLTEAVDIIYIATIGYKRERYGPVKLDHIKHQDEFKNPEGKNIDCTECHHDYQNGNNGDMKNVWVEGQPVQLCVECHDPNKSDGKKKKLQLAFHENCKDCHKKAIKAGIAEAENAPHNKCIKCMGKKM